MKKLPVFIFLFFLFICVQNKAAVILTAIAEAGNNSISLRWNMTNYYGTTAYVLLKSADGVTWQVTAANPVFRNYTSSTILAYHDKFSNERKLLYRVRIYDIDDKTVALSNTAVVANPTFSYPVEKPQATIKIYSKPAPVEANRNAWQLYPNPVHDMLNLVYRGKDIIKGVINVIVQDATGKAIIQFRSASKNKQLSIPVSNLRSGFYFIRINVLNEIQMNEKFVKQ